MNVRACIIVIESDNINRKIKLHLPSTSLFYTFEMLVRFYIFSRTGPRLYVYHFPILFIVYFNDLVQGGLFFFWRGLSTFIT